MVFIFIFICDFGWKVFDFFFEGVDGKIYFLLDVCGEWGILIMFICNYCFYVKVIIGCLVGEVKIL